jgi:hypothetical protein
LRFSKPQDACYADGDGAVLVADSGRNRVVVLAPDMTFQALIGKGQLHEPNRVCGNRDVVVVCDVNGPEEDDLFSESGSGLFCSFLPPASCIFGRVSVFGRRDGSLIARLGDVNMFPSRGCFLAGGLRLAIAEELLGVATVFNLADGAVLGCIGGDGERICERKTRIACSAFDELVVALGGTSGDGGPSVLRVYSDVGDDVLTFGRGFKCTHVAVHRSTVYATRRSGPGSGWQCVVWR